MARTHPAYRVGPQLVEADRIPISEIMTRTPITVHPELGIEDLVELFLAQNVSRVPVVDADERLIGIVSKTDLVVDQHMRGDTQVDQRGAGGFGRHVHELGSTVADVMAPTVFALPATTSIGAAARRMLADSVHAMPVISDEHRVIGFLSATDVLAWVAGVEPSP